MNDLIIQPPGFIEKNWRFALTFLLCVSFLVLPFLYQRLGAAASRLLFFSLIINIIIVNANKIDLVSLGYLKIQLKKAKELMDDLRIFALEISQITFGMLISGTGRPGAFAPFNEGMDMAKNLTDQLVLMGISENEIQKVREKFDAEVVSRISNKIISGIEQDRTDFLKKEDKENKDINASIKFLRTMPREDYIYKYSHIFSLLQQCNEIWDTFNKDKYQQDLENLKHYTQHGRLVNPIKYS